MTLENFKKGKKAVSYWSIAFTFSISYTSGFGLIGWLKINKQKKNL